MPNMCYAKDAKIIYDTLMYEEISIDDLKTAVIGLANIVQDQQAQIDKIERNQAGK